MASGGGSAGTVAQPDFLAARRERAAALSQTLDVPRFKGNPGWEFTDISGLDIAALEPAPSMTDGASAPSMFEPNATITLRQVDGGAVEFTGELPDGVIVAALDEAAAQYPELVSATSARWSPTRICSSRATTPTSAAAPSSTCPAA